MKGLVTGASGLVGNALARELLSQRHSVRALVRKTSRTGTLSGLSIELAVGDLRDPASLRQAVKGCDWVFNVAKLFWDRDVREIYRANVIGTRSLLEASADARVKRFVNCTGVTSIGYSERGEPVDEDHPWNMAHYGNHTQIAIYLSHVEVIRAAARGFPALDVSLGFVIGPNDGVPSPSGQLFLAYLNRRIPAYTRGGLNFIGSRDAARGHILAAEKGRIGERYILGNANLGFREFFRVCEEVTGVPGPSLRVPGWLFFPIGLLAPVVSLVTGRQPILTVPRVRVSDKDWYFSSAKAARELGFHPGDIRDDIREAAVWFFKNGHVKNGESCGALARLAAAASPEPAAPCSGEVKW